MALAVGSQTSPTVSQEANQMKPNDATQTQTQTSNQPSSGVTSGPAANSNVVPDTSVSKQQAANQPNAVGSTTSGSPELGTTGNAAAGVGAPGTPGKNGTEAGAAPSQRRSSSLDLPSACLGEWLHSSGDR